MLTSYIETRSHRTYSVPDSSSPAKLQRMRTAVRVIVRVNSEKKICWIDVIFFNTWCIPLAFCVVGRPINIATRPQASIPYGKEDIFLYHVNSLFLRPTKGRVVPCRQTDGWNGMTNLRVACCNVAKKRLKNFRSHARRTVQTSFRNATQWSLYRKVVGVNCENGTVHVNTLTVSIKL
jgi:hypothetical protein